MKGQIHQCYKGRATPAHLTWVGPRFLEKKVHGGREIKRETCSIVERGLGEVFVLNGVWQPWCEDTWRRFQLLLLTL
ncbi:hypothetical protein CEXT_491261 [Caerostris extrusa]|uniref:Uncharacterized protein n=1 Tax=Caerostris extrusa TaxID=172846 RepID=A0AAV4STW0_CAEEX|nr:hypothetical protein CEXT_491261 [Caerostris extrusa]